MALITILFSLVVLYYKIDLSNEMFIERITIFSGIIIALTRSLPQLVNLQGSLSTLRGCRKPTEDVIEYINKIKNSHFSIKKKIIEQDIKTIKFKNLSYNYKEETKKLM